MVSLLRIAPRGARQPRRADPFSIDFSARVWRAGDNLLSEV
jgi:hypothetical protein